MDFDGFLAQKEPHLNLIYRHLNIPDTEQALGRALASPVFNSYSKQPGYVYTSSHRRRILNESRAANQAAIREGIGFVEGLMKSHSGLGEIVEKLPLT